MLKRLFLLSVFLAIPGQSNAQWGPRACEPVGSIVGEWKHDSKSRNRVHWFENGQPAKTYFYADGKTTAYTPAVIADEWKHDVIAYDRAHWYEGGQPVKTYWYDTKQTTAYTPFLIGKAPSKAAVKEWVQKDTLKCCKCSPDCKCGCDCKCNETGIRCNCNCPCAQNTDAVTPERNYGIMREKMRDTGCDTNYSRTDWRGTLNVSKKQAMEAVNKLDDDSGKNPVVIVGGTVEQRNTVLSDLAGSPSLAWFKDKALVQTYADPGHYQLEGFKLPQDERFKKSGFMIALLSPPNKDGFGKLLYAQYDYDGGAENFSAQARPRVDPNFDPNKKDPVSGGGFPSIPWWIYPLAGAGIALFIIKK